MPKQLFTEGMLVLANDCGKHYGAKILRAQCFNNSWKYFIHFQHWNRKWDKWVDEGSLQKYSIDLDDQVKKCKKNEISFSKRSSYDGGGISGAAETHESFAVIIYCFGSAMTDLGYEGNSYSVTKTTKATGTGRIG